MWSVMVAPFATRGTAEWRQAQWGLMRSWLGSSQPSGITGKLICSPPAGGVFIPSVVEATDGHGRASAVWRLAANQRGGPAGYKESSGC